MAFAYWYANLVSLCLVRINALWDCFFFILFSPVLHSDLLQLLQIQSLILLMRQLYFDFPLTFTVTSQGKCFQPCASLNRLEAYWSWDFEHGVHSSVGTATAATAIAVILRNRQEFRPRQQRFAPERFGNWTIEYRRKSLH